MGWGEWTPRKNPERSPYEEWIEEIGGELASTRGDLADEDSPDKLTPIPDVSALIANEFLPEAKRTGLNTQEAGEPDPTLPFAIELAGVTPRIPKFANNEPFDARESWISKLPDTIDVCKDTVVVGVIDRGIPLGHRRTRRSDGGTRFLAAWQQIADRANVSGDDPVSGDKSVSGNLPFGVGLLVDDIQAALDESRIGGNGSLEIDEDRFNRLVLQEDYRNLRGHRELGRRVSHGAHVLDVAGGADPAHPGLTGKESSDQKEFEDKVRLIGVNLPVRSIVGLASQNLSVFVMLGILWTVRYADAAWKAKFGDEGKKSFPVVINLSFAIRAGVRTGDDAISRFMKVLNKQRSDEGRHPVHLVVPAGNDNLDRGHAHRDLDEKHDKKKDEPQLKVDWRLQPGDQSASFVEIWWAAQKAATPHRSDQAPDNAQPDTDLSISLTSPRGETFPLEPGRPGHYADYTVDGRPSFRIYCGERPAYRPGPSPGGDADVPEMQFYLLCTTPTHRHDELSAAVEAGTWRVEVANAGGRRLFVALDVQTDQPPQPESRTARLSYFDDKDYERFDAQTGRRLDTYNYPDWPDPRHSPPPDRRDFDNYIGGDTNKPNPGPVRRHGTMNVIATYRDTRPPHDAPGLTPHVELPGVIIAGGYRGTDGKPAPYSSTGLGQLPYGSEGSGLAAPLVAFPTDGGPAHKGYLAAGARDGSCVAMQGTSFAAAQTTRLAATMLLKGTTPEDLRRELARLAEAEEQRTPFTYPGFGDPEKTGWGRLGTPSWVNAGRYSTT